MIPESYLSQLVSGGEINLHTHPHTVTNDQRQRMQQLENVEFVSANWSATRESDFIFVDSTSGAVAITLPEARAGQHITVSRTAGANNVTLLPTGTDTINGAPSKVISATNVPVRLKAIVGVGYLEI
jgi:hypothetical protein